MSDLWDSASDDHEGLAREAALARADAEVEPIMPFLVAARSEQEFFHRLAVAGEALAAVEARNGLEPGELTEVAARRYALYREALAEGTDPLVSLEPLLQGGGADPERPGSHTEGPDFSGGYSEVPPGPPGGPDPQVTQVRPGPPEMASQASLRRHADDTPGSSMMPSYTPPDLGTGNGSVDIGTASPSAGGYVPSIPAGMPGGSMAPVGQTSSTTASRDPVRSRVLRATAMIAQANPGLPRSECERLGRAVVARWLRDADLTDSVMSNGPASGGGHDGGGSSGGGGGGMVQHMLEGQGLKSMLPGGGGGAAAGEAAEGAGAGAEAAEMLPLLAL